MPYFACPSAAITANQANVMPGLSNFRMNGSMELSRLLTARHWDDQRQRIERLGQPLRCSAKATHHRHSSSP